MKTVGNAVSKSTIAAVCGIICLVAPSVPAGMSAQGTHHFQDEIVAIAAGADSAARGSAITDYLKAQRHRCPCRGLLVPPIHRHEHRGDGSGAERHEDVAPGCALRSHAQRPRCARQRDELCGRRTVTLRPESRPVAELRCQSRLLRPRGARARRFASVFLPPSRRDTARRRVVSHETLPGVARDNEVDLREHQARYS